MATNKTNPKVEKYFSGAKKWPEVIRKLRTILLDCGLTEEMKWGKPCYAFEGGNVVLIQEFKAYCTLLFFKGALLKDPQGILVKTGVNTVVGRQIRFTEVQEVAKLARILKVYVLQAVEVEKSGLEVDVEKSAKVKVPIELQNRLDETPAFKTAFEALTPGRQRGYLFYFSGAKQSKTREARIEKCRSNILKGKGLNDQ